jgi:hypothetical protein
MGAAMQDVALETQSWYAKASSVAEETFFAIRTVVAFGGEHRERNTLQQWPMRDGVA